MIASTQIAELNALCAMTSPPINIYESTRYQKENAKQVEDITPVEPPSAAKLFCRITQAAIDSGHAHDVENELRSASISAPKLVKAIKTNEALGYLDTKNLNSAVLYKLLYEHFGLGFGLRTFQKYRNI